MSSIDFPHGNVFLDPAARAGTDAGFPAAPAPGSRSPVGGSSLAGMLAPLRARFRPVADGHELVIQPMRPIDALAPFTARPPLPDRDADDRDDLLGVDITTLLLPARPAPRSRSASGAAAAPPASLAEVASAAGIPLIERFHDEAVVVDDLALARLAARPDAPIGAAVRIAGPIEAADAAWIRRGLEAGVDPLSSEVRTIRSMQVLPNRTLLVHVRHARNGMRFAGESLRHFLAAVAGLPLAEVAPPDAGLLVPLFERSGELTVRPVETDVFSTSVDVGIVTSPPDAPRPADASLIYDLHGSSWHGE